MVISLSVAGWAEILPKGSRINASNMMARGTLARSAMR